jgi:hypothetical protein
VRGRAAQRWRCPHLGRIEQRRIGRRQILGHQNAGRIRQIGQRADAKARIDLRQHAAAHILKIGGARGQHRIAQRRQLPAMRSTA